MFVLSHGTQYNLIQDYIPLLMIDIGVFELEGSCLFLTYPFTLDLYSSRLYILIIILDHLVFKELILLVKLSLSHKLLQV